MELTDVLNWLNRLMHRIGERWDDEDDEYLQWVIDEVCASREEQ